MANGKHVDKLKEGVKAWNMWREEGLGVIPDLRNADLAGVNLAQCNLFDTNLAGADLNGADLERASLLQAKLKNADCRNAKLTYANFVEADLRGVDFSGADLRHTNLMSASLKNANLKGANLSQADFGFTDVGCDNLAAAVNLVEVRHAVPSSLPISTLAESEGQLPDEFLRGCGLSKWEILGSKLYNHELTANAIAEIQQSIFEERAKGFLLSGIFISYSHDDSKFVDDIYKRLQEEGANVWLDKHSATAGPLEKQVESAIRINDVALLVLSEHSIKSDWVDAELEWIRDKEKEQNRSVLCPVALDYTWSEKVKHDVLWRTVKKKNVLDFSKWANRFSYDTQFKKLLDGIKVYYGPNGEFADA